MLTFAANDRTRSARGLRDRDRQGGFTLVEVALALVVISLLAALGLPFLRPKGGATALHMKTIEVAALLRMERNHALRTGQDTVVMIMPDEATIQSSISAGKVVLPQPMSLQASGARGIQFFADGRSTGALLTIKTGSAASTISVNPMTSMITISGP